MQTGTWSAIGFPVSSPHARERFYEYANWCYQGGVFVSRSSGMVVRLSPLMLWSLPAVQVRKERRVARCRPGIYQKARCKLASNSR